jgi:hypothetical protein
MAEPVALARPDERVEPRLLLGRWDYVFTGLALGCGALLLYLGRSFTFWEDEWRSITFDGGFLDYIRPVNQHWSTFPLLLYRGTFAVVGLRSYIPYLAELVLLHLVAVVGVYALVRKRLGPGVATLACIPLLLLGVGAENLYWAFQTGFVGSVTFGVWAVFFIERRPGRRAAAIASVLLVAGLASSGMGVFFLVVVAGRALFDPALRRRALAVVPPLAIYLVWFVLLGRDQVGDDRVYLEPSVVRFAVRGVAYSTERLVGLDHVPYGDFWGLVVFLGLCLITGLRMARGRTQALAAGCLLGVAAMYTIIAFGRLRADPGYDHATSSRYVYVAAFLLVLAVVDLLPAPATWSSRGRRAGAVTAAALVLVLACATAANVAALRTERTAFQQTSNFTRAFVEVALARGHEPWVDRTSVRGWMPSVAELEGIVAQHGSPVGDEWFPSVVPPPDTATRQLALLSLVGDGFRVEEPNGAAPSAKLDVQGDGIERVEGCARAAVDPDRALWVRGVPSGARLRTSSSVPIGARVFLDHGGAARRIFAGFAAAPRDIVVPDIGDGRPWNVTIDSPAVRTDAAVCLLRGTATASARPPTVEIRRW